MSYNNKDTNLPAVLVAVIRSLTFWHARCVSMHSRVEAYNVYLWVRACVRASVCLSVCLSVCMHVYIHACAYLCLCVWINKWLRNAIWVSTAHLTSKNWSSKVRHRDLSWPYFTFPYRTVPYFILPYSSSWYVFICLHNKRATILVRRVRFRSVWPTQQKNHAHGRSKETCAWEKLRGTTINNGPLHHHEQQTPDRGHGSISTQKMWLRNKSSWFKGDTGVGRWFSLSSFYNWLIPCSITRVAFRYGSHSSRKSNFTQS